MWIAETTQSSAYFTNEMCQENSSMGRYKGQIHNVHHSRTLINDWKGALRDEKSKMSIYVNDKQGVFSFQTHTLFKFNQRGRVG